jgi:type IV secretory pathway VirB10-like protein
MTSKVDEILSKIPTLSVDLSDVFDFKDKCLDPLAISIITESLDYALETSVRRLESVAKINPTIRSTAVETVLPAVKTLRNIIKIAPECPTSALSSAPVKPPPPKPKAKPKKVADEELKKVEPEPTKEKKVIKTATKASVAETVAKKVKPTGTVEIGPGKQFEIEYGGTKKQYVVVDPAIFRNKAQVPKDPNIRKVPTSSSWTKLFEGKKSGDTVDMEIEGGKHTITIKDVREFKPEAWAGIEPEPEKK